MKFTKVLAEYIAGVIREFGHKANPVFSGQKYKAHEIWWVDLGDDEVLRTMRDYSDYRRVVLLPPVQEHNEKIWEMISYA